MISREKVADEKTYTKIVETLSTVSLLIPDTVIAASGLSENELFLEVILLLFQQEKLSLGKAAEILEMSQVRFQRLLSDRNICIHYDIAEFREDIEQMKVQGLL